uniref:Uncharacterized protein n=1 Tax=Anguilla anguilla TaxID=7936 RepID=A0A0E9UIP6_ANGAN
MLLLSKAHLLFVEKKMSAFVGALLVLTATSQVTVSACRAKPNHTVQCYGALGGSVILHLDIGSTVIDVLVKKEQYDSEI